MTARQVGTIVGQVVGAAIGGPIGAAIGGQIGGYVGGEIDGPQKGPRLDDTSAPAVEFGAKVPRVYGRVWCTLSPLWWSKLRESTANSGGKGAADSTVDNYVYHCDMLGRLADGSNVIAWTRIRIDGKIEGTRLADSSAESLAATATTERWGDVELRSGGPTQTPWSVMEAAEGAGNVSAYRDQCTFAITNLLMPNGRNPSLIEVEVITVGTQAGALTVLQSYFDSNSSDDISVYANGPGTLAGTGISVSSEALVVDKANDSNPDTLTYEVPMPADLSGTPLMCELIYQWSASANSTSIFFEYFDGALDRYRFQFYDNTGRLVYNDTRGFGEEYISPGPVLGPTHLAMVFDETSLRVYVNGNAVFERSGSHLQTCTNATITLGDSIGHASGASSFVITEFAVRRESVYTGASFAPPEHIKPPDGSAWTPGTEDLQDVLEAEMLRCAPLTSAHIDMSAAAGKEVWGFKASRSAAAECAVLLDWYYLDIFCGDKITVVERGGAVEQTIPYAYTGSAIDGTSDPFAGLTRGADVESQFATAVQYINILADGEVDTQQGQRVGTGSEVRAVNFSIYSKPTLAKGRADTITHDTRVAAHTATVHLGARQAARIQPGSVLVLVDNKGNSYRTRALRLVWNRGVYDVDVCLDDPNILKTVGITAEVDTSVIEVAPPAVAEFLPLDIPRVSDAQNAPGYLALVKTNGTTGARWFESPDDVTYSARFDFANDAVFGAVTAASGGFGQGVLFDEGSSITVDVGDGALASATREALLANRGLNLFAVGAAGRMVLGQFRTATAVSAGVYTLGGFVNMGANGTEQYCPSIAAGDDFALLGIAGTAQIPRSVSDLGVPFHVKAVAFGASLDNVTAVDFTANGVNLKPLSPVLLRAERDAASGDIAISWTRCTRGDTRFGGPLGDACPLYEATELYRVRLYTDGTYASVLRDLGSPTSPAVTYTAAQRAADGHTLTSPLYAAVTMVSDVAGEGYPLQDAA